MTRQIDGDVRQGTAERVAYSITTTPWGSSPSNVVVTVVDAIDGSTVTSSVTTGSPTVVGDVITLPLLHSLTAGHVYRVNVRFVSGANTFEPYFFVYGEV